MTTTYTIPAAAAVEFTAALAKMNKRAVRLGCESLRIVSSTPATVEIDDIKFPALRVEVEGLMPSFEGWDFAASVEALDSGKNIFHGPLTSSIPAAYTQSGHSCEHCGHNRKRNASFILRNGDSFKQVGSTCINDFLGGNRLPVFAFVRNSRELLGEFESFSNAHISEVGVVAILTAAAATIRTKGFVKKTGYDVSYNDGPVPTAMLVDSFLTDVRNPKRFIAPITDEDEVKAESVREWLVNHENTQSEYLQKLIDLAAATRVQRRNIGILASSVAAYDREMERKTQALASPSNHVGTVGKREHFTLEFVKVKVLPDYGFGCSNLYTFQDTKGNTVKWKTAGQFEFSGTVKLVGTVKKHGEWNGVKETELTRCKIAC